MGTGPPLLRFSVDHLQDDIHTIGTGGGINRSVLLLPEEFWFQTDQEIPAFHPVIIFEEIVQTMMQPYQIVYLSNRIIHIPEMLVTVHQIIFYPGRTIPFF